MRPLLAILGTVVGVGALVWVGTAHELIFTSFFGPKFEDVRRNTFERSKSFRTGAVQDKLGPISDELMGELPMCVMDRIAFRKTTY